ncbi:50S ribosomal protein L24 [archaeon]|nr:50S ribosomal protein L24 [archaeon]
MKHGKTQQKRKQRKNLFTAPLHQRKRGVSVTLNKELRETHKKRNVPVRKGDKVRVLRGNFKKHEDEVTRVNLIDYKIYVKGINNKKANGEETPRPVHPSNLMITELKLEDKKRSKLLKR